MSTSDVKIARLPTRLRPQLLPQQLRQRKNLIKKRNECQPSHCKPQCIPTCSSSQRCILDVMKKCGECPVSQCVSLASLGISTTSTHGDTNNMNNNSINNNANDTTTFVSSTNTSNKDKTGLIAGLTTGLVVGAVIVVAIAGLVYFKRKRRTQQQLQQEEEEHQQGFDNQEKRLEERVPTIQNINKSLGPPPAAAVLPATATLPTDTTFWPKEVAPPSPQSPVFMGNTLQIPRLTTTPSSPPPTSSTFTTTMTSPTTIRQSLSLIPSTTTSFSGISSSSSASSFIRPPPPMMSRSSSVKLTKYDHQRSEIKPTLYRNHFNNEEEDDDDDEDEGEDRVQLRRAISVNKKQGLSRSASLGSKTLQRQKTKGEAIPIVYARPTMVRINTITRKENGITRKTSVRTIISDNQRQGRDEQVEATEQLDTLQPLQPNERRLRTESWNSQHSIANSSHSSIGDGEITVFWNSPPINDTHTTTTTTTTTSANVTTTFNQ
ncbi:hypothetical protein INT45_013670 [Circinella minor]|uniref:Membrane anchor Opy2 N-terminal domain-containing protein n=1 Tax=Circinella minor TaxID=1195481 RepID=A0A8H7SA26_9FUNG|nr:hypothetical protein INT45_013670 [Circinella minor]